MIGLIMFMQGYMGWKLLQQNKISSPTVFQSLGEPDSNSSSDKPADCPIC